MMPVLRSLISRAAPLLGGSTHHVGLYLGGERLSAAQLQRTPAGLRLAAAGTLELGCPWYALLCEPRRFKHAVQRFWKDCGFAGTAVTAAMPHEQLKVFTLEYSASAAQPDAEVIAAEVKERLKGRPGPMVVDFVPVRAQNAEERQKEAVVAAATREDVIGFLRLLGGAGLQVRALDIAGMALRRVVSRAGPDMQNVLLLYVGPVASQLMVVWGRRLMLERSIDFSEQRLVSRVAKLLDLPEHAAKRLLAEEVGAAAHDGAPSQLRGVLREILGGELHALKGEVAKTLDYAASKTRGHGVDRILVVGALSGFPGMIQFLGESLGKPVERLDALGVFPNDLTEEEFAALAPDCGVAVAVGLALRGLRVQ
jgi:type IV pilus assembly protein PilM